MLDLIALMLRKKRCFLFIHILLFLFPLATVALAELKVVLRPAVTNT